MPDRPTPRHAADDPTAVMPPVGDPATETAAPEASGGGDTWWQRLVEFGRMSRSTAILLAVFVVALVLYSLGREDPIVSRPAPQLAPASEQRVPEPSPTAVPTTADDADRGASTPPSTAVAPTGAATSTGATGGASSAQPQPTAQSPAGDGTARTGGDATGGEPAARAPEPTG